MTTTTAFTVGQKVERKGKLYIVAEILDWNERNLGVRSINKKTGQPWQAIMYFTASEFKAA